MDSNLLQIAGQIVENSQNSQIAKIKFTTYNRRSWPHSAHMSLKTVRCLQPSNSNIGNLEKILGK